MAGLVLPHAQISETIRRGCLYRHGPACPYRMHRSRERFAAAMAHTVMARLVRAIYSSTCAATGGPDTPGHDDAGTFPATGHVSDFVVVSEMCEFGKACPGHLFKHSCDDRCPDTPDHDDAGTFPATGNVSDFAVVSEICEFGRAWPGHPRLAVLHAAKS